MDLFMYCFKHYGHFEFLYFGNPLRYWNESKGCKTLIFFFVNFSLKIEYSYVLIEN